MTFKEYPYINYCYVLHHTEGFGVMECPLYEREIIAASDNKEELEAIGREKYPHEKPWDDYDSWTININTSTQKGKELLILYQNKFKSIEKKVKESPQNYTTYNIGDQKITIEKNPLMDSNID